jgi:hypothetical protein
VRLRHRLRGSGQDHRGRHKEARKKLIDRAKKIDPKAAEELAQEVERDKEKAERFDGMK